MLRIPSVVFILSLVAAAVPADAQDYRAGDISVSAPWARATIGTSRPATVYFTIRNSGGAPDELLEARTPVAGRAELHETRMLNDVMQMASIPALAVGAGQTVTLSPAGYHLMLMDLKQPLTEGSTFSLSLSFKSGGTMDVVVPVQSIGATGVLPDAGSHRH